MPAKKWCSISVDLDEIPQYAAIHGLSGLELKTDAVYTRGLPRLLEWAEAHAIPLTLFAIAQDCRQEAVRIALRAALKRGHEIGNHSLDHRYDLTRLPAGELREQVVGAQSLFLEALGGKPVGFRAPGYTTSDALYRVLEAEEFQYSSSVFPCPPYYAAKVGAIIAKRLLGRRSASVIDDPRVLTAPTEPYRIGSPYWKNGAGILEFPIQTTQHLRLPYIGTTINMARAGGARWLTDRVAGLRFVNLELHGIDLLDRFDGLQALARHQPDLKIALHRKKEALDAAVQGLKSAGFKFSTLAGAAQRFGA